jgi:hypothetical protein
MCNFMKLLCCNKEYYTIACVVTVSCPSPLCGDYAGHYLLHIHLVSVAVSASIIMYKGENSIIVTILHVMVKKKIQFPKCCI